MEPPPDEVDHGDQISSRPVSPRPGFRRLNQAIEPLQDAVADPGGEPTQDAVPVSFNCGRGFFHGFKSAVRGPEVPFLQERF